MDAAHQARLGRILAGEIPAGSGEARTLGIMLLFELVDELRALRAALEGHIESSAPPEADPSAMLAGRSSDVRQAIEACGDAATLARCLELEQQRQRPRSTVLAAIQSRIDALA